MSILQAKGLVKEFKWYHLGFCFFWTVIFVALLTPPATLDGGRFAYDVCRQVSVLVVLLVITLRPKAHLELRPLSAFAAGTVLAAGSLMYYLAFFYGRYSLAAALTAGVLVGGATGVFYVLWQEFYASEGSTRTTIYIPLSAACSVALCLGVSALPMEWMVLCSVVILPALGAATLYKSLTEIVPYEVEPMTKQRCHMLFRDMSKPVFCVCAAAFVWQLVSAIDPYSDDGSMPATVLMAMCCAALAVSVVELFSRRGFDILRVYQVVFPLTTGAFILPAFLGQTWLPAVSVLSMFGFEVVNLLLLITCAVYASRFAMNASAVYAICVGPTLLSLMVGDAVGEFVNARFLLDFAIMVDVLFVCIYVLAAALFFVSIGRERRASANRIAIGGAEKEGSMRRLKYEEGRTGQSAEFVIACSAQVPAEAVGQDVENKSVPADIKLAGGSFSESVFSAEETADSFADSSKDVELTFGQRLDALGLVDPLSQRECEVAELLAHGNTVAAVARKLFISENTVRGHAKNIYRKLEVHSRQALIDLLG